MSDILTAIVTGVGILVVGQITTKFLIEPYQNYKKLVGEITASLVCFLNAGSLE